MTLSRIFLVLGLVAATFSARGAVFITEVMSSSANPSNSTANDDWFELTNTGPIAINLSGWSWDDESAIAGTANFGSISSIGPGESVIITGEAASAGTEAAAWRVDWGIGSSVQVATLTNGGFPGLSADGDTIYIFDNTNTIVTSVTFALATTGASFAWDKGGNYLGISVVGQYGAFKAQSNGTTPPGPGVDIGSPGYAAPVPEPGTVALLAGGLGVLLYGFRRRRFRG